MEITGGEDEGFVREWTPCTHMLNLIPPRVQTGLFSNDLFLTCIDAVAEYIALGTNVGLVYWYSRKKGNIQRLRCEAAGSSVTFVKIVSTVDFMVAAGNTAGQVTVFQVPKEHPESVPQTLRPKVEPKVERYTVGELHRSKITAIEWSKNGMRLFSGDKNGIIIMTEIDFYMHLCKSVEIVNEEHEIVQISYHQNSLLVSSVYRTILCEKKGSKWEVNQVGKKERKSLCQLGAVFQWSYAKGGAAAAYCARPGLRLWRADKTGDVQQTLLFKEAISNPLTIAELLNPSHTKHSHLSKEYNFGPLYIFRENFIVTHNDEVLYILDPRSLTAVAVVDDLRRILSVSVNRDEIFILEGERSVLRLGYAPETNLLSTEDPLNMMTKSLTNSLQSAVNSVRDFAHIDQTVPFIASVLEQPISIFSKGDNCDVVANAEECFELPPVRRLPPDMCENVLESIINEFKDVRNETEQIRKAKSEELQRKLKVYNSIMERTYDEEVIFSSKRSRKRESSPGSITPKVCTPIKKKDNVGYNRISEKPIENGISYTTPCVMNISSCQSTLADNYDELLEKQIEEKEKILAKMLDLESLSIVNHSQCAKTGVNKSPVSAFRSTMENIVTEPISPPLEQKPAAETPKHYLPNLSKTSEITSLDNIIPKFSKIPKNWNLENIHVKLDFQSDLRNAKQLLSPDDHVESEWEFV